MKFCLDDYTNDDCVMYCKTKEESESFLDFLHDQGRAWNDNKSYTDKSRRKAPYYFAYNIGRRSNDGEYMKANYSVLQWSDYIKEDGTLLDDDPYVDEYETIEDAVSFLIRG